MCLLCSHCYVPELFPGTQVLLLLGNPSSAGVTSTARGSALDLWSRPRRPQFHRGSVIPGQIAGQWLQITPRHLLSSSHGLHYLTKDTAFLLSAPHCPFPVYLYATFSMILHPKSSKSPLWTQVSSTLKKPCTDSAGWIRTTNSGQGWEGKPELPTQQPGSTLSMFPWQWGQMRRMLSHKADPYLYVRVSNLLHITPAGLHPPEQGHFFPAPYFSLSVTCACAPITNSWMQFSVMLLINKVVAQRVLLPIPRLHCFIQVLLWGGGHCKWMLLATEQLSTAYKGAGFSTHRAIPSHLFWTRVKQAASQNLIYVSSGEKL